MKAENRVQLVAPSLYAVPILLPFFLILAKLITPNKQVSLMCPFTHLMLDPTRWSGALRGDQHHTRTSSLSCARGSPIMLQARMKRYTVLSSSKWHIWTWRTFQTSNPTFLPLPSPINSSVPVEWRNWGGLAGGPCAHPKKIKYDQYHFCYSMKTS